jgi:Pyruvate/2-oxoacid:ferredoxin oxidoreductase delta subunit
VIPAIGQQVDPAGVERLLDGRAYFETGPWGEMPEHSGVYVGGDARGGYGTVSRAIGDGRRAAAAIDAWLKGEHLGTPASIEPIALAALNLSYFERAARAHEPLLAVAGRDGQREIAAGLDAAAVAHEGGRCLSCGNCLACDNCWTLCPDNAVLKSGAPAADGSHYVFDYDYCKGCGLCARECPTGYIVMEEDL